MLDNRKVTHPPHDLLFLLKSRLDFTYINFLLVNKREIITRISYTISNEVKIIEGTDQVHSKLFELLIDFILQIFQDDI